VVSLAREGTSSPKREGNEDRCFPSLFKEEPSVFPSLVLSDEIGGEKGDE
jgi:hypothetical protein